MRKLYQITSNISGKSITFPTKMMYDAFEQDYINLITKYKYNIQEQYGYWASNQDRFVNSLYDLNEFDIRDHVL